jgi:hypothetical protein
MANNGYIYIYTYNGGLCHYIASQNGNIIGIHWDVMGINMDIYIYMDYIINV